MQQVAAIQHNKEQTDAASRYENTMIQGHLPWSCKHGRDSGPGTSPYPSESRDMFKRWTIWPPCPGLMIRYAVVVVSKTHRALSVRQSVDKKYLSAYQRTR
jgi:hypothetical protein